MVSGIGSKEEMEEKGTDLKKLSVCIFTAVMERRYKPSLHDRRAYRISKSRICLGHKLHSHDTNFGKSGHHATASLKSLVSLSVENNCMQLVTVGLHSSIRSKRNTCVYCSASFTVLLFHDNQQKLRVVNV